MVILCPHCKVVYPIKNEAESCIKCGESIDITQAKLNREDVAHYVMSRIWFKMPGYNLGEVVDMFENGMIT